MSDKTKDAKGYFLHGWNGENKACPGFLIFYYIYLKTEKKRMFKYKKNIGMP
jgi:hypothetical protein